MRKYEEYRMYQMSMDVAIDIYKLTKTFPKSEQYGITSQIRRSAVSIPSNISEGASRESTKDFKRFLRIAQGSGFELKTQLLICQKVIKDLDQEGCESLLY